MAEAKLVKIVMMVARSGTRDGEDEVPAFTEIAVPKAEADNLIQQKQAVTPVQWAASREKRG